MKKVYLIKTTQFNKTFYTGSVDPRKLSQMVDKSIEVDKIQEDQRPLEKSHLLSISKYVGEKRGILPTSIIVGTKDKNKLVVEEEMSESGEKLYYMLFPDTDAELKEYENTVDISDGQHRIFSFTENYRNSSLKDFDKYEIPVTFFITPTLKERQEIFLTVNAEQKAVAPNLLMWLKYQLGLFDADKVFYMDLIQKLNSENKSPIRNRIILSAEKKKYGYKSKSLITIFSEIELKETFEKLTDEVTTDKLCSIISTYLSGWEQKYSLDFQSIENITATKMFGLTYILKLLPTFIEISLNNKCAFNEQFVINTINDLEQALNLNTINGETVFSNPAFKSTSILREYIQECGTKLIIYNKNKQNQFDPFA